MESNKTFRIIVIVTVSTLVTILTPVESNFLPLRDSFTARSLLTTFPPSNSPSQSESPSPSPAPGPEAMTPFTAPSNPPSEIDIDSPSPSPDAPTSSISPANPPVEIDMESPAESPADSVSITNPPSDEYPDGSSSAASSAKTLMSSTKNVLKQPLLSPELKTICGKTDYPTLCESSISPMLTAELKLDASSVLVLLIQASINATKAAMPTVDKVTAADCQELYNDAVMSLEDAVNAVKSGDIPTVNSNLSAAMTDYGTCNDGFEETGEPNPLADVGDNLTKMVSNCLAISTLIK